MEVNSDYSQVHTDPTVLGVLASVCTKLKEYVRSRVLLDVFFRALDSLVLLSIMSQPRIFSVKSVLKSDTKVHQALFQSRS